MHLLPSKCSPGTRGLGVKTPFYFENSMAFYSFSFLALYFISVVPSLSWLLAHMKYVPTSLILWESGPFYIYIYILADNTQSILQARLRVTQQIIC